jgi:hypothetical protein
VPPSKQVNDPLIPSDQIKYRTGSWLEEATSKGVSREYRQPAIQNDWSQICIERSKRNRSAAFARVGKREMER